MDKKNKSDSVIDGIRRSIDTLFRAMTTIIALVLNPISAILIIIICIVVGIIISFNGQDGKKEQKNPSIVLNIQDLKNLGFTITEKDGKSTIEECRDLPKVFDTNWSDADKEERKAFEYASTEVLGSTEKEYAKEQSNMLNLCLYHHIFLRKIQGDYDLSKYAGSGSVMGTGTSGTGQSGTGFLSTLAKLPSGILNDSHYHIPYDQTKKEYGSYRTRFPYGYFKVNSDYFLLLVAHENVAERLDSSVLFDKSGTGAIELCSKPDEGFILTGCAEYVYGKTTFLFPNARWNLTPVPGSGKSQGYEGTDLTWRRITNTSESGSAIDPWLTIDGGDDRFTRYLNNDNAINIAKPVTGLANRLGIDKPPTDEGSGKTVSQAIADDGESEYFPCVPPPCEEGMETCPTCQTPEFSESDSNNILREYKEFVFRMIKNRVVYGSNVVGSPYRNQYSIYDPTTGTLLISCGVSVRLTQRDGYSNASQHYPVEPGGSKRVHAGLDLAAQQADCTKIGDPDKWDNANITYFGGRFTAKTVPVFSIASGEVISSSYESNTWGNTVIVKSVIDGVNYFTRYSHLDFVKIEKGDSVETGDMIGTQGNSGGSFGPHLDLTITKEDTRYFSYVCNVLTKGLDGNGLKDIIDRDVSGKYNENSCGNCQSEPVSRCGAE